MLFVCYELTDGPTPNKEKIFVLKWNSYKKKHKKLDRKMGIKFRFKVSVIWNMHEKKFKEKIGVRQLDLF